MLETRDYSPGAGPGWSASVYQVSPITITSTGNSASQCNCFKKTICCWHQAGGHSFDCFEPDFKNKFACLCLILEANSYSFIDWGRIAGAHPLTSAAAKLFTANWILIHLIRFNLNKQPNFSPRLNSSTRKPNISQLCLFPKLYWSLTLFMKLNKSNCCPSLFWLFMVSSTFSNPAQMSKHHRFTIYINSSGLHLSTSIWGLSHIYDLFALPWFI